MKKLMFLALVAFASCSNKSDIDDPTPFCWDCLYHFATVNNGQTTNDEVNVDFCNKTTAQIRQHEKDNSKVVSNSNGSVSTVKVTCSKK